MGQGEQHRARKRFGQHFLVDGQIIQVIVASLGVAPGDHFIEIGPGLGALTLPLLSQTKTLTCIELDRDVIPKLQARSEGVGQLNIVSADVLKVDFASLLLADNTQWRVVGNLPYNISTPIIFHLIAQLSVVRDMHFMLQKEVVDRMVAAPGSKTYGRLSVMVQYYCEAQSILEVPPEAFEPPPKVDSAVVRLVPYLNKPHKAIDETQFAELVASAFATRRKTLRNNLKRVMGDSDWAALDIDPSCRPETCDVATFVRISNHLS